MRSGHSSGVWKHYVDSVCHHVQNAKTKQNKQTNSSELNVWLSADTWGTVTSCSSFSLINRWNGWLVVKYYQKPFFFVKIIRSPPKKRPILKAFTQCGRYWAEPKSPNTPSSASLHELQVITAHKGKDRGLKTGFLSRLAQASSLFFCSPTLTLSDPTLWPLRSKDFCQNPMQPVQKAVRRTEFRKQADRKIFHSKRLKYV